MPSDGGAHSRTEALREAFEAKTKAIEALRDEQRTFGRGMEGLRATMRDGFAAMDHNLRMVEQRLEELGQGLTQIAGMVQTLIDRG